MNEFCKIITLKSGHQVLIIMSHDDEHPEDGPFKVERITEYEGVRFSAKAGYPSERLQNADFETFAYEDAEKFFNRLKEIMLQE